MPNDENSEKGRRGSIQSIDRATAILKALASGPRRLGVSELADRLGLARPTVHGLLQTLQSHGFVEQDRHSDKYQLGPGLLQLGYSYLDLNELRARSIGYADRLASRAGAAVRVGVMHGSNVVVVHHVFKPDSAFGVLEVGLQLPLHASSLGKAILAFSSEQTIEDLLADPLPRLTKRTLTEAALRQELRSIRDQGVATERDEAVLGESSAASPIFDHGGRAVGAIGVVDATERIFPRGLAKGLSASVSEAARGVSRELGALAGHTQPEPRVNALRDTGYLLRVAESEILGLLVAARDEPGVLYRLSETIFRHGANVTYVAGGAHRDNAAELQLEVAGAPDTKRLIADLEGLEGVTKVSTVPTFERIYGKRVIVIGGGAQVGMVAQGAISEADRHNIRGERISVDTIPLVGEDQLAAAVRAVARLHRARALVLAGALMGGDISTAVREIREVGILVLCTNMAGSVPDAADLVVSDPVEAGVMAVMLIADTAKFSIEHVRGKRF